MTEIDECQKCPHFSRNWVAGIIQVKEMDKTGDELGEYECDLANREIDGLGSMPDWCPLQGPER